MGQHQAALLRPNAHQMNGIFADATVVRTAQGFAIDRDDFTHLTGPDRTDPIDEMLLKGTGVKRSKDAPKGVVRGDTVG